MLHPELCSQGGLSQVLTNYVLAGNRHGFCRIQSGGEKKKGLQHSDVVVVFPCTHYFPIQLSFGHQIMYGVSEDSFVGAVKFHYDFHCAFSIFLDLITGYSCHHLLVQAMYTITMQVLVLFKMQNWQKKYQLLFEQQISSNAAVFNSNSVIFSPNTS